MCIGPDLEPLAVFDGGPDTNLNTATSRLAHDRHHREHERIRALVELRCVGSRS